MMTTALRSVFKILKCNKLIEDEEVFKLVCDALETTPKTNVNILLKLCLSHPELLAFFRIVDKTFDQQISNYTISNKYQDGHAIDQVYLRITQTARPFSADVEEVLEHDEYAAKRNWVSFMAKKLSSPQTETNLVKDVHLSHQWIYGIRCDEVIQPMQYFSDGHLFECLVYFTSSVVVVYDIHKNQQQHFTSHKNEVCSVDMSPTGLVATGERGSEPAIFLWHVKTLQTSTKIVNSHNSDIYILRFVHDSSKLLSCACRLQPSVIVHSLAGEILSSVYLEEFVRGVVNVERYTSDIIEQPRDDGFVVFSRSSVFVDDRKCIDRHDSRLKGEIGEFTNSCCPATTTAKSCSGKKTREMASGSCE